MGEHTCPEVPIETTVRMSNYSFAESVKPMRKFVRTTDSDHNFPVFPNLYRNNIPDKVDQVWVGYITYIRLSQGFAYLAAILMPATGR